MARIRIENLHFRYPAFDPIEPEKVDGWALAGVSLEIPPGEFLGVVGTTGSGKSTLCLALCGLAPQQTSGTIRGDVWVGEWNTKRTPVVQLATRVGIVFQDPEANFLGLTVEDEVAFGPENLGIEPAEIASRVRWALDLVGMSGFDQRMVAQLSGGQKQRVAIAAVLAMTPEVLVLDDPTSELDPSGTAQVLDLIEAVRQRVPEMTVVMTSGDAVPLAEGADRVAVLHDGNLIAVDEPSGLFADPSELIELGVPVPAVSSLATKLNARLETTFAFSRLDQADDALTTYVKGRRSG